MSETFKCATCGCEHSVALSTPISDPDYYTRLPAPPSREAEIAARLASVEPPSWEYYHSDDVRYLLAQLQQAREALRKYGQHDSACVHLAMPRATPINELHYPCTCGLDAALKAVR